MQLGTEGFWAQYLCYRVLEIAPSAKYFHFWKANVPSSYYTTHFPLFMCFKFNRGSLNNSGTINPPFFELVKPGPRKNTVVKVFLHLFFPPLALEHSVFCRMSAEMLRGQVESSQWWWRWLLSYSPAVTRVLPAAGWAGSCSFVSFYH